MPKVRSRRPDSASGEEKTLRLARKRFTRRQRARRWLAWRRVLLAVLVAAVVGGSVWLVFLSSVLAVTRVDVEGTEVLEPQEVRRAAEVPTGEPLATVRVESIAARIESLAPVKRVDVSRSWPDGVRISIVEREAVAVVEGGGSVRGIDAEGVLFRTYASVPKKMPVLRPVKPMDVGTESAALAEAAAVVDALPPDLAAQVDYVEVETIDTISLRLRDGRTIFWGSGEDSVDKAKVIAVLLEQRATAYDVSVPAQPTIRR